MHAGQTDLKRHHRRQPEPRYGTKLSRQHRKHYFTTMATEKNSNKSSNLNHLVPQQLIKSTNGPLTSTPRSRGCKRTPKFLRNSSLNSVGPRDTQSNPVWQKGWRFSERASSGRVARAGKLQVL